MTRIWYALYSNHSGNFDKTIVQNVRRLALSALNSAARTKPHLIRDHLPTLLPSLYAEMKVNPDLIRTVQMGPWTHKVDDGLDARKTAWETLYTLVSIFVTLESLHAYGHICP
jgi:cullin-associated NEDD8-dissociated protein 1